MPHFRGVKAIDKAIQQKERFIGNTAHFIDEGVDTGPIILQNVMLTNAFYDKGYDAILDEQVKLLLTIDKLLKEDRISVANGQVFIKDANYAVSHLYPEV